MFRFVGVNLSLNPRSGASIFFGEFLEGGAVVEILFEECFAKSPGASLGGKTAAAIVASILLNSSVTTVLLDMSGTTFWTFFYNPSVKKSF